MRRALGTIIFSSAVLMLPLENAKATTVQYSTYSSWASNVTNPLELDFSKISQSDYSTSSGITLPPMSGPALPFVVTGPLTAGGYQLTRGYYGPSGSLVSLFGPTAPSGNITVTLPSGGENAIYVGLGVTGSAANMTVTLSDGEVFSVPATVNAYDFLAISMSHNISWLTISSSSQPVLNDFFFGGSKLAQDSQAPPSAEVGTLLLIGGGLVLLYAGKRKLFPNLATA